MITLLIIDERIRNTLYNLSSACSHHLPERLAGCSQREASDLLEKFINEQGYQVTLTGELTDDSTIVISEEDLVAMILKWGLNDS